MRSTPTAALLLAAIFASTAAAQTQNNDACRKVLEARVKECAEACIERAKAAVAPEIRGRILGYGCTNNCMKLEMFNGHTCPP